MLNQKQRDQLRNSPTFDKTLLNTYEQNNPLPKASGTVNAPSTTVDPNTSVDRISRFNSALNVAVDQARQQRKDSTLDMVGGMLPTGALPAASFASVLSAFDADSAPLEATLIDSASEFAMEEERRLADIKLEISDLALKVGQNGGSQDTVNAILALSATGDLAAATQIAATGLAKKGVTADDGGALVDAEGNVIFNPTADMSATKAKEYIKANVNPDFYAVLDSKLTDAELRSFYEFWMRINANGYAPHGLHKQQSIRADLAYAAWLDSRGQQAAAVGITDPAADKPKSSTKKNDDEDTPLWELHGVE